MPIGVNASATPPIARSDQTRESGSGRLQPSRSARLYTLALTRRYRQQWQCHSRSHLQSQTSRASSSELRSFTLWASSLPTSSLPRRRESWHHRRMRMRSSNSSSRRHSNPDRHHHRHRHYHRARHRDRRRHHRRSSSSSHHRCRRSHCSHHRHSSRHSQASGSRRCRIVSAWERQLEEERAQRSARQGPSERAHTAPPPAKTRPIVRDPNCLACQGRHRAHTCK